jgi:hypothetical protein
MAAGIHQNSLLEFLTISEQGKLLFQEQLILKSFSM